jgi:hypothetical protein
VEPDPLAGELEIPPPEPPEAAAESLAEATEFKAVAPLPPWDEPELAAAVALEAKDLNTVCEFELLATATDPRGCRFDTRLAALEIVVDTEAATARPSLATGRLNKDKLREFWESCNTELDFAACCKA